MNKYKTILILIVATMSLSNANSEEKVHPIEEIEINTNKAGETVVVADSVYPTPCYDVSSKTAVVNTFNDTIVLKQKSEPSDEKYCTQVITPKSLTYNLGDVPDGQYEVIDSFDDSMIDEVKIQSAQKRTVVDKIK